MVGSENIRKTLLLGLAFAAGACAVSPALAQTPAKPNVIVIMGDDIGWMNVAAYGGDIMGVKTVTSITSTPTKTSKTRIARPMPASARSSTRAALFPAPLTARPRAKLR